MAGTQENHAAFAKRISGLPLSGRIESAYNLAKQGHRGQKRKDGTRYFEHPRAVALILFDELDIREPDILITALLHDILEDTHLLSPEDIGLLFGSRVAAWVEGNTRETGEPLGRFLERAAEAGFGSAIVRFADRLHNLRSSRSCAREFRAKYIRETVQDYLPMLRRLATACGGEERAAYEKVLALMTEIVETEERIRAETEEGYRYVVLCQPWIESERGWGQTSDGCSLHVRQEDVSAYEYTDPGRDGYGERSRTGVPDIYSRPWGDVYKGLVDPETYRAITSSAHGIRVYSNPPKVDGSFEVGSVIITKPAQRT